MIFNVGDRVEYFASNFIQSKYNGSRGTVCIEDTFHSVMVDWDKDSAVAMYLQSRDVAYRRERNIFDVGRHSIKLIELDYDPAQQGDREEDV